MWTQSGDRPAAKPEGLGFRQRIGAKTRMASHGPPRLWEAACTFSEALEQLEHKELVSSRNSASLRHKGCLALPAFLSPRETHFPDVRSTRPTAKARCRVKERTRHGASDGRREEETPRPRLRLTSGPCMGADPGVCSHQGTARPCPPSEERAASKRVRTWAPLDGWGRRDASSGVPRPLLLTQEGGLSWKRY